MVYLVAFDGEELSAAALERAAEYASAMDERVVSVTVVPQDEDYVRERGWIDDDDPFTLETVTDGLSEQIRSIAPSAEPRFRQATATASPGMIASKIRSVAREVEPTVVFVGSDNAGGLVTPISSVGGTLTGMADYDVYIVRHPRSD